MIDFIELFNKVARVARPAHHEFVPITSMDTKFVDSVCARARASNDPADGVEPTWLRLAAWLPAYRHKSGWPQG